MRIIQQIALLSLLSASTLGIAQEKLEAVASLSRCGGWIYSASNLANEASG